VYKPFFETLLSFLLGINPGVGLLDHLVVLRLLSEVTSIT
jgi:hypothetical protein